MDALVRELTLLADSVGDLAMLSKDAPIVAYVILAACVLLLVVNLWPHVRKW